MIVYCVKILPYFSRVGNVKSDVMKGFMETVTKYAKNVIHGVEPVQLNSQLIVDLVHLATSFKQVLLNAKPIAQLDTMEIL